MIRWRGEGICEDAAVGSEVEEFACGADALRWGQRDWGSTGNKGFARFPSGCIVHWTRPIEILPSLSGLSFPLQKTKGFGPWIPGKENGLSVM